MADPTPGDVAPPPVVAAVVHDAPAAPDAPDAAASVRGLYAAARVPLLMVGLAVALYAWSLSDRELTVLRLFPPPPRGGGAGDPGRIRDAFASSVPSSSSSSSASSVTAAVSEPELYPVQCERSWPPTLAHGTPRCTDTMSALRYGAREQRDGPFFPWQPDDPRAAAEAAAAALAAGSASGPASPPAGHRCGLRWYSPSEACALLSSSGRLLLFLGDSLVRHFEQALYIVLSGDYERGGMNTALMEPSVAEACTCEAQFNDFKGSCRLFTKGYYNGPASEICPGWDRTHVFSLLQWYNIAHMDVTALHNIAAEVIGRPFEEGGYGGRALLIANTALHEGFNTDRLFGKVYGPILSLAQAFPSLAVFCMTAHSPQTNKPPQHWGAQGFVPTQKWNEALRAFCEGNGGRTFETYAMTHNSTSQDGTHYLTETNVMVAQALLNLIAELDGDI
jgi:hypothetical protein